MKQAELPRKVGEILLPEVEESLPYGEVIEKGPDVDKVEVGDKIYFEPRDAAAFPLESDTVMLVREKAVFCRVHGEVENLLTLI